jgi:cysteinyl-tRNA synthetase
MLRIFNSLTGRKEPFRPLHPPAVGLYVCGVTVYDLCHVGHARCYVAFDVIRRWLRYRGYDVRYVRNITDIDDKIIRRAAELGEPVEVLTRRYTSAMHADFAALGIEPADFEPRATEHIPAIITMIERLLERGHAYVGASGDVFYSVATFADYGRLSGKRLEDLRSGARVEINESKRDPLDFVLWKRAKAGEPHWPSAWGEGRPGWHIECSAMSTELLGSHFDLHGGGMDLKFPHHENEIAQSCTANDGPFVDTWMHNGFVNVDNQKMSKSLGNFFTIREVLPYLRHPEVLRAFLLASHYRGPINYSPAQLVQADAALTRLYTALRDLAVDTAGQGAEGAASAAAAGAAGAATPSEHRERFEAALDDDFNTPEALAALQGLARELNSMRAAHAPGQAGAAVWALAEELMRLASVLGVLSVPVSEWFKLAPARALPREGESLRTALRANEELSTTSDAAGEGGSAASSGTLDEAHIEALIDQRLAARAARNFAEADRIRDELKQAGVLLEDHAGGRTTWKRAS